MGDIDLVRPLGLAGIRCAVVALPGEQARFSRFTVAALDYADAWEDEARLLEILIDFGERQRERPVLYYETDGEMLLVARHRARLAPIYRFLVPDVERALDLIDKGRFTDLARRLGLPVPRTCRLELTREHPPSELEIAYPFIIKPVTRRWGPVGVRGKAMEITSATELGRLWPRLRRDGTDFVAQELIPGPESRVESYHAFLTATGEVLGEFTGRKIRTWPVAYGHSTALETSDAPDVMALGRSCARRLGVAGALKLDFKRGPRGDPHLLEVNPRYSLWHHLGAVAGVNLPAIAYAHLTGSGAGLIPTARAGVTWCKLRHDFLAARAGGMGRWEWLRWASASHAKRAIAWDDPLVVARTLIHRIRQRAGAGAA